MDSPVEIHDGFKNLTESERSESMSATLSRFSGRMRDSNERILSRVLDLIAETEGDEQLHLDMLATHLAKETPVIYDVMTWPGDFEEYSEITQLSEFMPQTGSGSETGLCPWAYNANGEIMQDDEIPGFVADMLQGLQEAVRNGASRELLGDAADALELPAEFCEFYKQTQGVMYANWDRVMFVCDFASMFRNPDCQVQSLEDMCFYAASDGFKVAAGWNAGENSENSWIYYLLCKDAKDPDDEPWQWRVFYNNSEVIDQGYFDSLNEFLSWYASGYDWVEWKIVKRSVGELHQRCKDARAET